MISPGHNPNEGNQKGGKENSNAAVKGKEHNAGGEQPRPDDEHRSPEGEVVKPKGQVGNTHHGG